MIFIKLSSNIRMEYILCLNEGALVGLDGALKSKDPFELWFHNAPIMKRFCV